MLYSLQRDVGEPWAKLTRLFLFCSVLFSFIATTVAQPAPEIPKNAEWTYGPGVCALGDLAEMKIPEGFRFTDAAGAKSLLERMKNPVPKGLLGIIAPNSGGWWVILNYSKSGYVAEPGADQLDAQAILASLLQKVETQNAERASAGMEPVDKLDWTIKPTYDPAIKAVEWAVTAQAGPQAVLNHTVTLLNRQGVLNAIAVRPVEAEVDLSILRKLMADVKFKTGQQYADYRPGDKLATKSMAELIVDDAEETKTTIAGGSMKSVWISVVAVLLLVCFVAAGATVAVKKMRSKAPAAETPVAPTEPAPALQPAAVALAPAARPVLIKARTKTADFKARPAVNGNGLNGAGKQRRGFDYNRYFTDLMSNVYSGSYGADIQPINGANEEVNGYSYGVGAPVTNGKTVNGHGMVDTDVLAAQKSLLEEQRRLIQEQSKLIEEKSRLIEEKNKILHLQSQLLDRKLV